MDDESDLSPDARRWNRLPSWAYEENVAALAEAGLMAPDGTASADQAFRILLADLILDFYEEWKGGGPEDRKAAPEGGPIPPGPPEG